MEGRREGRREGGKEGGRSRREGWNLLNNATLINDNYSVSSLHCTQPMGDNEHCTFREVTEKGFLNLRYRNGEAGREDWKEEW